MYSSLNLKSGVWGGSFLHQPPGEPGAREPTERTVYSEVWGVTREYIQMFSFDKEKWRKIFKLIFSNMLITIRFSKCLAQFFIPVIQ